MYELRKITLRWQGIEKRIIVLPGDDLKSLHEDVFPTVNWKERSTRPTTEITAYYYVEEMSPMDLNHFCEALYNTILHITRLLEDPDLDATKRKRHTEDLNRDMELAHYIFNLEEERAYRKKETVGVA